MITLPKPSPSTPTPLSRIDPTIPLFKGPPRYAPYEPHPFSTGDAGRIERSSRPPAWIVLVGGVAMALAVLFVITRLTSANTYTPLFTGGARAQISQRAFDYGNVKNNTMVKTTFTIQNVGDKQLYFPDQTVVQVVEGCCPPRRESTARSFGPVRQPTCRSASPMHEGMDGPHNFRVKVLTNDVVDPSRRSLSSPTGCHKSRPGHSGWLYRSYFASTDKAPQDPTCGALFHVTGVFFPVRAGVRTCRMH